MRVIERVAEHYDVQSTEFGRIYKWCPGHAIVECECGERLTLTSSMTTCRCCGADHAPLVREELAAGRLGDKALHPWRYAGDREDTGIPF
jgi:hypothetical protein